MEPSHVTAGLDLQVGPTYLCRPPQRVHRATGGAAAWRKGREVGFQQLAQIGLARAMPRDCEDLAPFVGEFVDYASVR